MKTKHNITRTAEQIKPGYKKTKVGVIPEDWEVKRLGEIGLPKMCKRIFKEQTTTIGDIPFYKIGTFGGVPDAFITKELFEEYKSKYSFPKKGDILISAAGTIGRLVVYDGIPAYFQDSNIVWIDNNEKLISNKLLFYIYSIVRWQKTEGGIVSRLYNSDLKNVSLPIPPLPEQEAIADCLTTWDKAIEIQKKLIAAKKLQKKGLMQQIFNGQLKVENACPEQGRSGQLIQAKDGEDFTKEWKEVKLGEVFAMKKGKNLSKSAVVDKGKHKCVLYGELYTKYSEVIHKVVSYTNEEDSFLSKVNDVLIPSSTTTNGWDLITSSCIQEDNVMLGGDIIVLRPKNNKINSVFFSYLFSNAMYKEVIGYTQGVTIIHLYGSDLVKIKINLPSIEEQTAIAELFQTADKEIELLEKQFTQLELQKKGLMQVLLTGTKRLVES